MSTDTANNALQGLSFEDTATAFSSKSDAALLKAYMLFSSMNSPLLVKAGTSAIRLGLSLHLPIKFAIKKTLFEHFCGGEDIEDCEGTIKRLSEYNIGTILDYSVEGEKSEKGFDRTEQEIIATIARSKGNDKLPFCVFKVTGIATTPLLEKVQSGKPLSAQEQASWEKVQARVDRICKAAFDAGVRIFIDGEETWIQESIDQLAMDMMAKYNRQEAIVYNTYQLYVAAKLEQLKADFAKAQAEGFFLGAKLVRGAYMEKERARAESMGYPDPIQPNKAATDRDFNLGLEFCMENRSRMGVCAGTHNEFSSMKLAKLMQENGVGTHDKTFFFAQLYGMSDHISYNLAKAGYNVAKYVPYGPVRAVMPYLFRRADENTSIAGQTSREFTLIQKEWERRKKK